MLAQTQSNVAFDTTSQKPTIRIAIKQESQPMMREVKKPEIEEQQELAPRYDFVGIAG